MKLLSSTLIVLVACAIAWLVWSSNRAGEVVTPDAPAPEEEEVRVPAVLSGEVEQRDEVADTPEALDVHPAGSARETIGREAAPEPDAVTQVPKVAIFGQVADELGLALPGVSVTLLSKDEQVISGLMDQLGRDHDLKPIRGLRNREGVTVRTDAYGAFDFGEVEPVDGLTFIFGRELFAGEPPKQAVVLDGLEQFLRLPGRPRTGLVLELRGKEGAPAPIPEWVSLDLARIGHEVARANLRPHPRDVVLQPGEVTVHGLAPGKWTVLLRCRGALPIRNVVTVEPGQGLTVAVLEIDPGDRSIAGELAGEFSETRLAGADAKSVRDSLSGFDRLVIKGQKRRELREPGWDAHFGHTITGFGVGPVQAAFLEIELEGHGGMCQNDGLYLEFRGLEAKPRWAWSKTIESLPEVGSWKHGKRRRLLLDLSALPRGDATHNLLSELEDGRLDVFVQDDTSVLDLALHVHR